LALKPPEVVVAPDAAIRPECIGLCDALGRIGVEADLQKYFLTIRSKETYNGNYSMPESCES